MTADSTLQPLPFYLSVSNEAVRYSPVPSKYSIVHGFNDLVANAVLGGNQSLLF
jgi:hypothetical protein